MPRRSKPASHSIAFSSLPQLFEHQATRIPEAPAVLGLRCAPLTYGRLFQHIQNAGRALRIMGIGRHDRVVVVLPSGPEAAVTILSVAAHATCIPVNPDLRAQELDRYFADLRPCALVTQAGCDSASRRVALSRGIVLLEVASEPDAEVGLFTLARSKGEPARSRSKRSSDDRVSPSDVALLMLTSGTTSQPKVVPLTHANICSSAGSTVKALALSEADRCINMLPLFHGHGLNNLLLGSLAAGASVVCTGGCDVTGFFGWLSAFRPTWYSAVPTMHQAIVAHSRRVPQEAAGHRLRFVRSSSAPLPHHLLTELEQLFEAPVIEFYGLTESSSAPIACNPLPPLRRKFGSVGLPVDLELGIMDNGGSLLRRGQIGEIVARGASVVSGYDGDPAATEAAFAGGWLKTGDLGFLDDDGYLFLAGRIREIINRGGEKIAPQEVDDVLLQHSAVAAAATFAIPHATLGEDVAAAVVLRSGRKATAAHIRRFVVGRIAHFKVPQRIMIVKEIPKGPTGKVQRIGMAAKLGLTTATIAQSPAFVEPRTSIEKMLAKHWAELLGVKRIGVNDNFFSCGGDSLLAIHVLAQIYHTTQIEMNASQFFDAPTISETAQHLQKLIRLGQPSRTPTIVRSSIGQQSARTSVAQERIWRLQRALPEIPLFNVTYVLRLTSRVDSKVLERSINEIVKRHEMLRTIFGIVKGRRVQFIVARLKVPLHYQDLNKLQGSRKVLVIREVVQEELHRSFDLMRGPLVRVRLLRFAKRGHLLLFSMPAIIQDGWSLGVLVEELAIIYGALAAGRRHRLAPVPIQYADFARWQRRWRSYPEIAAQLTYWRDQLHDPLPLLKLSARRSDRGTDIYQTARRKVALPANLADDAKRFARREGITLFMTLIAAFKTLLHRCVGLDDLRVATHVANRNRPQTERLIGPLVNTVILRTNLGGDPNSREVMRRIRATTLAAFANQDIPFEEVVASLTRKREPSVLAQVMLWLQNAPLRPAVGRGHGLSFEELDPAMLLPVATVTAFDVMLMLRESPQGVVGTCVYKTHLFTTEAIDRLVRDFQQVLKYMIRHPERQISAIPVSCARL
jgi:acyl-CoA synthetase (AMP-forming)/AMP-acid ligase II